jgi:hypothetical protein
MSTYEDKSYPPIGKQLKYQRGDGAVVTLQIDPPVHRAAATQVFQPQHTPVLATTSLPPDPQPEPITLVRQSLPAAMTAFLCFRANSTLQAQKACLDSFLTTTQPEQLEVRIVMLGPDNEARKLVEQYIREGLVAQTYVFTQNTDKFAAMSRVFHDNACRIESPWVLWADDCVLADVNPNWLAETLQLITTTCRTHNAHLFGSKYGQTVAPTFRDWIKSSPWYKKRTLRNRNGQPDNSGTFTYFVQGQCFVISKNAIEEANVPDPRCNSQCGAVVIGEQVYQQGYNIRQYNNDGKTLRLLEKPPLAGSWDSPGAKNYVPGYCGDWYRLVEGPPTIPIQTIQKAEAVAQPAEHRGNLKSFNQWTVLTPPPLVGKYI